MSRKALRLYEAAGIVPPLRRTAAGYRVYGGEALAVLSFVAQARRLGFRLDEIKEIIAIKRSGGVPCGHVLELVTRKTADVERTLGDLREVRDRLRALRRSWPSTRGSGAIVCPHIEQPTGSTRRRKR